MAYRTLKFHVKGLNDNEKSIIKTLAFASTKAYNEALKLIENDYNQVKTLPKHTHILKKLNESNLLKDLGYGFEAVVKVPLTNYKTYITRQVKIEASRANPSWKQIDENINLPQPVKYSYLYSEKFRRVDDTLQFPIPYDLFKRYGAFKIKLPERYQNLSIKSVSIQFDRDLSYVEMMLKYEETGQSSYVQNGDYHALAIDLGVNNMATCVTSQGDSFIIDGRHLKSIIQGYEKYTAIAKRKNQSKSKLAKIRKRKQNQVDDYLNKSVHYIIQYCLKHHIGNIIIGYNPNFKKGLNLGKENNQLFFQMPYAKFMEKLAHQCNKHGIELTKTYEYYTSKASFLDGDDFPNYLTREKQNFSGRRKYRGLYIASDGRKINADVNGALNILSKCKAISHEKLMLLRTRGVAQPVRVKPLKCAGCN